MTTSKTWRKPIIKHGKFTKYNYIVQYPEGLKLGKNFDIGTFTYINARYGVTISDLVQIGSHCSIYSHSTIDDKQGPIVLKKNCRIGTHSTIMPKVTIGKNSIVSPGSVVTQDVPDKCVVVGNPARVVKKIE